MYIKVDGYHIRSLWIGLIYKYFRPLIENGHMYIAQPPLYKVENKSNKKEYKYCYSDEERDNITEQFGGLENVLIQAYKGLGQMSSTQLRETTLDPKTRTLFQVTLEDAENMEKYLNILMDEDSNLRKEFYIENSELCNIVE